MSDPSASGPTERLTQPGRPNGTALLAAVAVFVLAWIIFVPLGKQYVTNDSLPYRFLPLALLNDRSFVLDEWPQLGEPENYAIVRDQHGRLVSKKPPMPAMVATPLFAAYRLWNGDSFVDEGTAILLGQWTAGTIGALSAGILAAALVLGGIPLAQALFWGLAFVLCTPFWFVVMDLWPHAFLALANVSCLLLLNFRSNRRAWLAMGFLQGIAFAVRPGAASVGAVFFIAGAFIGNDGVRMRLQQMALFAVGLLPALAFVGLYNLHYFGGIFTTGFGSQLSGRLRFPLEGVLGLLFSPAKGLFLFSPLLLTALLALRFHILKNPIPLIALLALAVHTTFWGAYADWWGGWAWGPRYLSEAIPFFILLAAFGLAALIEKKQWRGFVLSALALLAIASLSFQFIGWRAWNGDYHLRHDLGWGDGRRWVWSSPHEPTWRWEQLRGD